MSEKAIHWFPGHMQKALREIEKKLKVVDIVVELADARAPKSSLNPFIIPLIANKTKILILTKLDLADSNKTSTLFSKDKNYDEVLMGSLNDRTFIKSIKTEIKKVGVKTHEKQLRKGIRPQPLKVLIIGIPNVGKSTLINKIANRAAASVQNKPGLTRAQQYIKVDDDFVLIDTPGVLPPNYDDKQSVMNLALIGSIRQEILPINELTTSLLDFLKKDYLGLLNKRYGINVTSDSDNEEILLAIAASRNLLDGSTLSTSKAEITLLNEYKNGVIGRISINEDDNE